MLKPMRLVLPPFFFFFFFLAQQRKQLRLKLNLKLVLGYYKYKYPYQISVHGHLKNKGENNYKKNVKPVYCTSWFTFWSISQTESKYLKSQLGSTLPFLISSNFQNCLPEHFGKGAVQIIMILNWSKMHCHKCYI